MSGQLDSWIYSLTIGGGRFVHPHGPAFGVVELQLEARPLRRMTTLLAELARELPDGPIERPPIRALHTDEGEHAALGALIAPSGAERHVGLVIGDETCTCFVARRQEPRADVNLATAVEALVVEHRLGLGYARLRRYDYTPPPGWRPVTRATETRWMSPSYAEDQATLIVPRARPIGESLPVYNMERIHEEYKGPLTDVTPVARGQAGSGGGLAGVYTASEATAPPATRVYIVEGTLYDLVFAYPFFFQVRAEHQHRHDQAIGDFVTSVKPLPQPRTSTAVWSE